MLFAVRQEADRIGKNRAARGKFPERLPAGGVQRIKEAFARSAEDEPSTGREQPGPGRRLQLEFPRHSPAIGLEGFDRSGWLHPGNARDAAPGKPLALSILPLVDVE